MLGPDPVHDNIARLPPPPPPTPNQSLHDKVEVEGEHWPTHTEAAGWFKGEGLLVVVLVVVVTQPHWVGGERTSGGL